MKENEAIGYIKGKLDWRGEEFKDHREREYNNVNESLYDKGYSEGYNKAIDDVRDMLLDLISNGYEYPNKQFLDGIYGVVNDAMVDVVKQLKERDMYGNR